MPITIMGETNTNLLQMVAWYDKQGKEYPELYADYGAPDIEAFCSILLNEAETEGVRAELVFAQAMLETGWLQFGGDVKPEQCNFCGLGATGGGVPGWSFSSVRMGLRAQIQHLKAYGSTEPLVNECIDPRFKYVTRGVAPDVEDLGGRWAPSSTYGERVASMAAQLLSIEYSEPEPEPEPAPVLPGNTITITLPDDFYDNIAKAVLDRMYKRLEK